MKDIYDAGYIESVNLPEALIKTAADAIAKSLDEDAFAPKKVEGWRRGLGYGGQVVFALAYLYTCEESPLAGEARLLDAARTIGERLAAEDHLEHRQLWALVEARRLLEDAGEGQVLSGANPSAERSAQVIVELLGGFRHLTHMTSSNMGTSTNHVAVMSGSLLRYAQEAARGDWFELAREIGLKVAADQNPDGYWAETTGGPTMLYNYLTFCAMGRLHRATGDDAFARAARKAAELLMHFAYPDGCNVETVDGRCRYHPRPMMWGGFVLSETPRGRGFVALKLRTFLDRLGSPGAHGHGGELLALLCEDHMLWVPGPVEPPPPLRERYVETLTVGGMVRREGPWAVAFASPPHIPRPGANFTIDRQCIFSVWHAATGLIVNGSGEDSRPETATFRIDPMWQRQHRLQVPESMGIDPGDRPTSPSRLRAEYRGGTCRIETLFRSGSELEVRASAGSALKLYPVHLTVPLELDYGGEMRWASGSRVLAEGEPLEIAPDELGGRVGFGGWELSVESDGDAPARLEWPYDPHNPYSPDRKSPPGMHVGLLRVELPPEGARLRFTVKG